MDRTQQFEASTMFYEGDVIFIVCGKRPAFLPLLALVVVYAKRVHCFAPLSISLCINLTVQPFYIIVKNKVIRFVWRMHLRCLNI